MNGILARLGLMIAVIALTLTPATASEDEPAHRKEIRGILWQVDDATVGISGGWHKLGANELLVQWSVIDDVAYIPGTGLKQPPRMPNWDRIAKQPWAQNVIMGLASMVQEPEARKNVEQLIELSSRVARLEMPVNVTGWYFPVEADPTWMDVAKYGRLLAKLPRPLWISVYDNSNIGAQPFADWLKTWVPNDVGIFFQDGVGIHSRDARGARIYADTLVRNLGADRVKVIAEAFRPDAGAGFRPATAAELATQLDALKGLDVYIFDGPHHVNDTIIQTLIER